MEYMHHRRRNIERVYEEPETDALHLNPSRRLPARHVAAQNQRQISSQRPVTGKLQQSRPMSVPYRPRPAVRRSIVAPQRPVQAAAVPRQATISYPRKSIKRMAMIDGVFGLLAFGMFVVLLSCGLTPLTALMFALVFFSLLVLLAMPGW